MRGFVEGLTGGHDAFTGGDNLAVCGAGCDHSVIRLRAVQLIHLQFRAGHVGLENHDMVTQARQGHLKVDEELGLWVAPVQLQAAGGDVGDVKRLFLC